MNENEGPIGGGGSHPVPEKKEKATESKNIVEKTVSNKIYKTVLSLIPVLALLIITASTNFYYFFDSEYYIYYDLISYFSGFSIASLPAYFYIVYTYKFCYYSKISLWGITTYVFLNIIWTLGKLFFNMSQNIYTNIFEALSLTLIFIASLYFLITQKR